MSVRRLLRGLVLFVSGVLVTAEIQAETPRTFTNPVIESGADPWVIRHDDGWYYLCGSSRNEIFLVRSRTLTGLASGERKVVRKLQLPGPSSLEVWAPELHWLDNAWYIYFAASDGNNANHRMFVLENTSADPFAGSFTEKGKIIDRLNDDWAIDGTVLTLGQAHYFLWSGADATLNPQVLYISLMENPWTLTGRRIEISRPAHDWERRGNPKVNEGPQVLIKNDKVMIVYSASGSWTDHYCLGLLTLEKGASPLNPRAWTKHTDPVFQSTSEVFGPGHASFTTSPDGKEDWIVYHAARQRGAGWKRDIRMQPFTWRSDDTPDFGTPVPPNHPVPVPSGE